MDWIVCPQNSYAKALIPNMTIFVDGPLRRQLRLNEEGWGYSSVIEHVLSMYEVLDSIPWTSIKNINEIIRTGPLTSVTGILIMRGRGTRETFPHAQRTGEVRIQLGDDICKPRREVSLGKKTLPTHWSWTFSLHNCGIFCCFSHPVCGISLWQL